MHNFGLSQVLRMYIIVINEQWYVDQYVVWYINPLIGLTVQNVFIVLLTEYLHKYDTNLL